MSISPSEFPPRASAPPPTSRAPHDRDGLARDRDGEAGAHGAAIAAMIGRGAPLVLLLDYDGTLAPLAPTPAAAAPDGALLARLSAVARRPATMVHVVSGRPWSTLADWLGHLPIGLHAEHGLWSRWSPTGPWLRADVPRPTWLDPLRPALAAISARIPGSFVEEKSASLAWHHRACDPVAARAGLAEVRLVASAFAGAITILPGHEVLELRPRGVNKGLVVAEAVRRGPPGARIVAVGDDRTDEDMFAALPEGGLSVHVGGAETQAAIRVADPAAVHHLLDALVEPQASTPGVPPRRDEASA